MSVKNAAEILVQCLETEGVRYIFGVPGEENLTFLEAVRKSKITFITTRHEQAAAFMAATFGRMTGKVGVAMSTLGPGATNLLTGVAYSQLGGFPLLVITGQKPLKKSRQGKFQIVDIVSMMKPITKFSATITSGDLVPSMIKEAIRLAKTERPGAVHLELPEDIALEICNSIPLVSSKTNYPSANKKDVSEAIAIIENSKHPIIILGGAMNRSPIRKELKAFFKKTGIPFVSTQMGKGAMDENSPLYIGTTALSGGEYVHQALHSADTIILVGHDVIEKPPIILTPETYKNSRIIHINLFISNSKGIYIPTHEVIGDISRTIMTFTEKIKINPSWDFSYFLKVRDEIKKAALKLSRLPDFPFRPERIISDIQKVLPPDGILALANGMYTLYSARTFITKEPHGILLDNTLATMGAGLPSGIALKILYPNKKVLVVAGDGGIMMSIGDLETAVRLKIDLVVLILDDSGFGMIRWEQKELNLPPFGLSFNNPDFIMLAKNFGATGHKIDKIKDFASILQKVLDLKGVHIIACPINYNKANEALEKIKHSIIK